jgi:hypothetical protein
MTSPRGERGALDVTTHGQAERCVRLPSIEPAAHGLEYVTVELAPARRSEPAPIRYHLYASSRDHWLLAGLERLVD